MSDKTGTGTEPGAAGIGVEVLSARDVPWAARGR